MFTLGDEKFGSLGGIEMPFSSINPSFSGDTDGYTTNETDAGAIIARSDAIQEAIDNPVTQGAFFRPGVYQIDRMIILPRGSFLRAMSPHNTWIVPKAGFSDPYLVQSKDYAFWEANLGDRGQWAHSTAFDDDIPMIGIQIRDIGFNGNDGVLDRAWLDEIGSPDNFGGIDIQSPGCYIHNVKIHGCRGCGIFFHHGDGTRFGQMQPIDEYTKCFDKVWISACYDGLHIPSKGDGSIRRFHGTNIRDRGLWVEGGAWNVDEVHISGASVGIENGGVSGTTGENYYDGNIQLDFCNTGLINHTARNSYNNIIAKLCGGDDGAGGALGSAILAHRGMCIGGIEITTMQNGAPGIIIEDTCKNFEVRGGAISMHSPAGHVPGSYAFDIRGGEKHNIKCFVSTDDSPIAVNFGSVGAISRSQLDITQENFATGMRMLSTAKGNELTIRSSNPTATPIDTGALDLTGNRIRDIQVNTGVQTIHQDWD